MLILSVLVSLYKGKKFVGMQELEKREADVKSIISNGEKLRFISEHGFGKANVSIESFTKDLGQKNFSEITKIYSVEESIIGTVKKTKLEIEGFFWHDLFIFEFLNEMQNFKPGFIKILSVEIDKFSKILIKKPALKVNVVCEVFQKYQ
jgi:hypothetical protein